MAGPTFQPFNWVWKRYSYSSFLIKKDRLYDRLYAVFAAGMIGFAFVQGVNLVFTWQDAVQNNYKHYLKKERLRAELAEMIRVARESGELPFTSMEFD